MQSNTYNKYLKYKIKYALLKYELYGGAPDCDLAKIEDMLEEIKLHGCIGNIKECSEKFEKIRTLKTTLDGCEIKSTPPDIQKYLNDKCLRYKFPEYESDKIFKDFWKHSDLFRKLWCTNDGKLQEIWDKYPNFKNIWKYFVITLSHFVYEDKEYKFLNLYDSDSDFRALLDSETGKMSKNITLFFNDELDIFTLLKNDEFKKIFYKNINFRNQFYDDKDLRKLLYTKPNFAEIWLTDSKYRNNWKNDSVFRQQQINIFTRVVLIK
jgi:hypothetical protein